MEVELPRLLQEDAGDDVDFDPSEALADEAAETIQEGFKQYMRRKRLHKNKLDAIRRKKRVEERTEQKRLEGGPLHWTATDENLEQLRHLVRRFFPGAATHYALFNGCVCFLSFLAARRRG